MPLGFNIGERHHTLCLVETTGDFFIGLHGDGCAVMLVNYLLRLLLGCGTNREIGGDLLWCISRRPDGW